MAIVTDTNTLVVVLGSPNDAIGTLGPVALSRVERTITVHAEMPSAAILPTGGFGDHFNRSPEPHHVHVTRELAAAGVPTDLLLPGVNSSNTVEDAALSCEIARRRRVKRLVVVTSDFHEERAAMHFRDVAAVPFELRTSTSTGLDADHLALLTAHETKALQELRRRAAR